MNPNYRLQARNVFLTYPRCLLGKQYVLDKVKEITAVFNPIFVRVGHEFHEDGGDHLHVFAQFSTKLTTRNNRFFDIDGYHPNVQAARQPADCMDYCGKDGDFIDWGEFTRAPVNGNVWAELIEQETKEEFWNMAKLQARDYILNHERLEYYCEKYYGPKMAPYVSNAELLFDIPDEMDDWFTNEFPKVGKNIDSHGPLAP